MNESILETGSLVSQAEGVILIKKQVFSSDLPTSQQYSYLSEAEERQADEYIAAWEQHNAPWTLGSYLKSLRQSTQTPLGFDYSSTSSSVKPDKHYGQPPDRESHPIAAGTGQMPTIHANQKKVPKSGPAGPGKRQAANPHSAHIGTGATYKLPTGEIITEQQKARRIHFAGFPPITQPLPEDLQDEDIIKQWPNHLWGPLLLGIAEKWKSLEISRITPVDLGRNAISKRIKAARIQGGEEIPQCECRKRKLFAGEGKPLDEHQVVPQPETESEDSQAFRMNNNREMGSEDLRQSFRMNNARAIGLEDVRQSDRLRKRRKSAG